MIKVETFGSETKIRIDDGHAFIWMTHMQARQLIADIMAALGEPMKPDVTTQAYQEFNVPCKTKNVSFTVGELQDSGDLPELKIYDPRPSIREQRATATAERMSFENDLQRFVSLCDEAKKRGWLK